MQNRQCYLRVWRTQEVTRQGVSQRVNNELLFSRCFSNVAPSYVEMLEQQQSQLVNGLQELYRRTQSGQGWTGSPLKESTGGHPLTHDILERLGALQIDPSGRRESFEENLALMQRQLFEAGAAPMQRQGSDASGSDSGQRSIFDSPTAETSIFTGPFANYSYGQRGLPTPPTATSTNSFSSHHNSLRQASVYPGSPSSQSSMSPSQMNRPSFPAALSSLNDDFAFLTQLSGSSGVDLPMADIGRGCMPLDADGPCMMPDFTDEDFNAFVNRIP